MFGGLGHDGPPLHERPEPLSSLHVLQGKAGGW
jgi:hypothetical protein